MAAASTVVASLGILFPATAASTFTWLALPPLHARFLGAVYLFGLALMAACLLARRQAETRWAMHIVAIWTGIILLVSALHLEAFNFSQVADLAWWTQYVLYFAIAAYFVIRQPKESGAEPLPGPDMPSWASRILLAEGVVLTALAAALLVAPETVAGYWPWKVDPMLAQIYSGPLMAIGLGGILFSRQQKLLGAAVYAPALLTLSAGVLLASLAYFHIFSLSELADALWFAWFGASTLALLPIAWSAMRARAAN